MIIKADRVIEIVIALGIVIMLFVGGGTLARCLIRQEAVDHGAAEWVVDQETGKVRFEWLTVMEDSERIE